jgi:hemoglobin-like flavoprotein
MASRAPIRVTIAHARRGWLEEHGAVTPEQIAAVQQTFAIAAEHADDLAVRFYERLFTIEPSVEPLFSTEPALQRAKFVDELTEIVRSISALDRFVPRARDLGERHVGYGVRTGHYRAVGQALLDAFGDVLGPLFTTEARAAWAQAYDLVAETMMEGAATVALPPSDH